MGGRPGVNGDRTEFRVLLDTVHFQIHTNDFSVGYKIVQLLRKELNRITFDALVMLPKFMSI